MKHRSLPAVEVSLDNKAVAVRQALHELIKKLEPFALDIEELDAVELVMAEVLNNVVEHAYPNQDTADKISVRCTHQQNGLIIVISDRGTPMPDGKVPLGTLASRNLEMAELPEGGFGWFLIQHLAKDIAYRRVAGENRLSLRMAVGLEPATAC